MAALPNVGPMDDHFRMVAEALLDGNVVPFLGAGVNLGWTGATVRPPSSEELAQQIAGGVAPGKTLDLLRVSQYVETMLGSGPLYERLRRVFNQNYPITPLHDLLAKIPAWIRQV